MTDAQHDGWIASRFGTSRGLIRLALAHVEQRTGRAAERPPLDAVTRLVFVCLGNICRSAHAEAVARSLGLEAISFGLSTSTGGGAHPPAIAAARALGHDLTAHRTTALPDYEPRAGDLLLAMETRQLRRLAADPRLKDVPRLLLGRFAGVPHLHDPYGLGAAYMRTSLVRIERAVRALAQAFPDARAAAPSPADRAGTAPDRAS